MRAISAYVLTSLLIVAIAWAYLVRPQGDSIRIVSEVSGRIENVFVTEGSTVHLGDVLIQLDTRGLLLKKSTLESRIHFTELRTPLRSDLAALYQELEQTRLDLNRLTITSPADGEIKSFASLHSGEMLLRGTPIAVVVREAP